MRFISAAALGASVAERYPNLGNDSGVVDQLNASGDESGTVDTLQAAGIVSYTQPTGKLVYVRVLQQHLVAGHFVEEGDIVQVTDLDAKTLVVLGRATPATDEEVAAAQKGSKK